MAILDSIKSNIVKTVIRLGNHLSQDETNSIKAVVFPFLAGCKRTGFIPAMAPAVM